MMEVVWIIAAVLLVFVTVDTIKTIKSKKDAPPPSIEVVSRETERMVKLEAEVDEKIKEIKKHESVSMPRPTPVPPAAQGPRDPMNDTRCIQAVTEKAEEIERLGREKGISKR